MITVLVTGADGFIGKNLIQALARRSGISILKFDVADKPEHLLAGLAVADVVFHLAGVNRPDREEEFIVGNADLTERITSVLSKRLTKPLLVLSSSIQAEQDNPYGRSKRKAEMAVEDYGNQGGKAVIFRLPNVFGKWSRPNYNSAVATFCHNICRGLNITISDSQRIVELVYIDDVVRACVGLLEDQDNQGTRRLSVGPVTRITLGQLVQELQNMRDIRSRLVIPDMSDYFRKCLYTTYLSFLPIDGFAYQLTKRDDTRGSLAELLKSPQFGQIFLSRTKPGIVRGNHYHDTKVEKFCVVQGEAVIAFRHILGDEVISYRTRGEDFQVVDIPPGYTHCIENIGNGELVVLFWSSEPFNPDAPDTYPLTVTSK